MAPDRRSQRLVAGKYREMPETLDDDSHFLRILAN